MRERCSKLVVASLAIASIATNLGCQKHGTDEAVPEGGARCEARSYSIGTDRMQSLAIYDADATGQIVRAEWQYRERTLEQNRGSRIQYAYDAQGHLVTQTKDDDADGKPDVVERYTYDAAGHLVHAESIAPPSTVLESSDRIYENGQLARTEVHRNGTVVSTETVSYSADGKQRVSTASYAQGHVFRRTREDLDGARPIRVFDETSGANLRLETKYDASGRVTSETTFDKNGEAETTITYHYDDQGLLQSSETSDRGKLTTRTSYGYRGTWKSLPCGDLPRAH